MECLLPYLSMVTVPHVMVGLERMLDYRGVGLERFHCIYICILQLYIGNSEYYITKQFSSLLSGRALLLSALSVSAREP